MIGGLHMLVHYAIRDASVGNCRDCPCDLCFGPDKDTQLMRGHTVFGTIQNPSCDSLAFLRFGLERANFRGWAVEDRDSAKSIFLISVHVRDNRPKQLISLSSDLV